MIVVAPRPTPVMIPDDETVTTEFSREVQLAPDVIGFVDPSLYVAVKRAWRCPGVLTSNPAGSPTETSLTWRMGAKDHVASSARSNGRTLRPKRDLVKKVLREDVIPKLGVDR